MLIPITFLDNIAEEMILACFLNIYLLVITHQLLEGKHIIYT
jgi:hypothetical protein